MMMKFETLKQLSIEKKKLKAACAEDEERIKIQFDYLHDNAGEMVGDSIEYIISKFSFKRLLKSFFIKKDESFGIGTLFTGGTTNKVIQFALTTGLAIGMRYFKKLFGKK